MVSGGLQSVSRMLVSAIVPSMHANPSQGNKKVVTRGRSSCHVYSDPREARIVGS